MMLALLLGCASSDPNAAPEVAWDHVTCDECGMLVSEPAHAAAYVTPDGEWRVFDDPGCLFRYMLTKSESVAHLWFHDDNEWLHDAEVGFLDGGNTPMGSHLTTVRAETPGAMGVGEASNKALSR